MDKSEAQAVVSAAKAAETDGLQVELGGSAIGLTETSSGHTAEIVAEEEAAAEEPEPGFETGAENADDEDPDALRTAVDDPS